MVEKGRGRWTLRAGFTSATVSTRISSAAKREQAVHATVYAWRRRLRIALDL